MPGVADGPAGAARRRRPVFDSLGPALVDDARAAAETRDGQALPPAVLRAHLRYVELAGGTEGSVYARRRALARMCGKIPVPLLEAGFDDLLAWREGLHIQPESIGAYVAHAREFYGWAVLAGLRSDNPADDLPVPRVKRRIPRPIGEEKILAAVAAAPPRVRMMLVLAGWSGLRAQEIARLRRSCILDTASPPVLIVEASAAKGGRERIVPLSDFVLEELRRYGLPRAGYLFRRGDGRPGPNRPWSVSAVCNRYLHDCGHPETLHQLRHRFGTMTYRASLDLRMVQELMGHQSPTTTAGYAAYAQEKAAAIVAQLAAPGPARVPGGPAVRTAG